MDRIGFENIELIDNNKGDKKRFEIHVEGHIAFMEYMLSKQGIIYITHTEVPKQLEGKGIASALAGKVMDFIARSGLKLAPLCPFLASYLKRHPEKAKELLAPGYSIGS
ncbi:MAG: GNAT family N-acetyltransferase [Sediminicola sp.]|tara:strand:+ start:49418 stop:49744 length:327 start_codon:yes stop_codon:yes gene_type:complete